VRELPKLPRRGEPKSPEFNPGVDNVDDMDLVDEVDKNPSELMAKD
jgi:hypothetical protein